jgi:hypothetical protein
MNLCVRKQGIWIELALDVGSCVIRLAEDEARTLCETITGWLR